MKYKAGLLLIMILMVTSFWLPKFIVYAADDTIYLKSKEDERGYSVDLTSAVHDNKTVKKIVFPENATYILFDYRYETDRGILQNYKSMTPNCPNLSEIVVESNNPNFTVVDNILYSKDLKTLFYCPPGKTGEVVLPSQVEKIGYMAFQGCEKITSITFSAALKDINDAAFGKNICLVKIKIPNENRNFKVESDVLFSKDGELLYLHPAGIERKEYNIPDGVRRIVPGAFLGNSYLQRVSIPNSVTSIGIEAFRNCKNLFEVQLNEGLLEIEAGAFYDCVQLKSMTFPNGIINIYPEAIHGCKKLLTITIPQSVQAVPSDINEIKNRVIYCYNPYSIDWLLNDKAAAKASNAVVYLYKGSETEHYVKDKNVKMKYLKPIVPSNRANVKMKQDVVKGAGKPDVSWYSDKKTSFLITNPDQLAGLATLVNRGYKMSGKTFLLQNDIDLSCYENWEPIGIGMTKENKFRRFMGTFDGKGHTIYSLRINRVSDHEVGLFGIMEGTIKNVMVENADVVGNSAVGILCGTLWGGKIENCKAGGVVTGCEGIGGLIGTGNGEIIKCNSDAIVNGNIYAGGILGKGNSTIIESSANGKVIGYDAAGGISGGNYGEITSCKNFAVITGNRNTGGIVGEILRLSGLRNVNKCTNYASVKGIENTGGIVGSAEWGQDVKVNENMNEGEIEGHYYVGGIIGYSEVKEITNSKNYGKVSGISSVGGIAGILNSGYLHQEVLLNCSNHGTVIGKNYYGDMYGKTVE